MLPWLGALNIGGGTMSVAGGTWTLLAHLGKQLPTRLCAQDKGAAPMSTAAETRMLLGEEHCDGGCCGDCRPSAWDIRGEAIIIRCGVGERTGLLMCCIGCRECPRGDGMGEKAPSFFEEEAARRTTEASSMLSSKFSRGEAVPLPAIAKRPEPPEDGTEGKGL